MEDDVPLIYGLEFQARSLCAQTAETDVVRFLVGTQSLKFENQLHQVEFDEENNSVSKRVFLHRRGEIWQVAASPTEKNTIATVYNRINDENSCEMVASLWQLPEDSETGGDNSSDVSSSMPTLEPVCDLLSESHKQQDVRRLVWHPANEGRLITVLDRSILVWDVEEGQAKVSSSANLEAKGRPKLTGGQWGPHQSFNYFATTNDTSVRCWDLRTMKQTWIIENAHGQLVRDLDLNPNKQYYLATCGDDCYAKFWDVRNVESPVLTLSDHSHWVWSVRYNHFHDQLVLTSSSDSRVVLSSLTSISSEPYGHLVEDDATEDDADRNRSKLEDGVIGTYEEHEDSVYSVEWSSADPWTFASLSYDGRLVINKIPRAVKYKILL